MKALNNYLKEMKIATSGFYFYIEIVVAFMIMLTLVLVVPTESKHVINEVIFMDMSTEKFEEVINQKSW